MSTGLNPDPDAEARMAPHLTHETHQILIDALLAQARAIAEQESIRHEEPKQREEDA